MTEVTATMTCLINEKCLHRYPSTSQQKVLSISISFEYEKKKRIMLGESAYYINLLLRHILPEASKTNQILKWSFS